MPDWTASMQQTYEYYEVDPATWADRRKTTDVTSSSIIRDVSSDTGGSASFNVSSDLGEIYIRTYLVTTQKGITERTVLGTHLCQTKGEKFDGKRKELTVDAYGSLQELKDSTPPIGYSLAKGEHILDVATRIARENLRAPVIGGSSTNLTLPYPFVSELNDTWHSYLSDLLGCARYTMSTDNMGNVVFLPDQDANSLQPVWVFDDGNSSIIQPDFDTSRDLYGIPNVLEVVYSKDDGSYIYSKAVNDDPDSPISTVNRGRKVVHRITNPELNGTPTQFELDEYAKVQLKNLSSLEYTISYVHGYCPVNVGDCVLLNYERAGLKNRKAKVTRQSIKCETGCMVQETAVYTTSLWG